MGLRAVGCILLGLIVLGWLGVAWELPGRSPSESEQFQAIQWRRTANGWERSDEWLAPPVAAVPRHPHPFIIGCFELLVSLGGLLYFAKPKSRQAGPDSGSSCARPLGNRAEPVGSGC